MVVVKFSGAYLGQCALTCFFLVFMRIFCLLLLTRYSLTGWQHSVAHGGAAAGCGHVHGEGKCAVCAVANANARLGTCWARGEEREGWNSLYVVISFQGLTVVSSLQDLTAVYTFPLVLYAM